MNCLSLMQQVSKTVSVTVSWLVLCAATEMGKTGRMQQFHRKELKAPQLESWNLLPGTQCFSPNEKCFSNVAFLQSSKTYVHVCHCCL